MKIAVAYNQKRASGPGQPKDFFAEYDDISVPMAIKQALESLGHQAQLVEANQGFYSMMVKGRFDFVFNIAEGINSGSRESQVPAILDMLDIPYTGSGVLTLALTLDKRRTKEVLMYYGIPTPRFCVCNNIYDAVPAEMRFPLIIKPNSEGSSKGIGNDAVVYDEKSLRIKLEDIIQTYKQPAIIEEFLDGREFTVSILGNKRPRVLPIVEVTFDYLPSGINRIDSYEVKWIYDNPDNPIDPIKCPADIPYALEESIKKVALDAYHVLGCQDLARIDIRLDSEGVPNILEVNALPGLIPDPLENSRFPKACYAAKMSYQEMIGMILDEAVQRYSPDGLIISLPKERGNSKHT